MHRINRMGHGSVCHPWLVPFLTRTAHIVEKDGLRVRRLPARKIRNILTPTGVKCNLIAVAGIA